MLRSLSNLVGIVLFAVELIFGFFLLFACLVFAFQFWILLPIIIWKGWIKDDKGIIKALRYLRLYGLAEEFQKKSNKKVCETRLAQEE